MMMVKKTAALGYLLEAASAETKETETEEKEKEEEGGRLPKEEGRNEAGVSATVR